MDAEHKIILNECLKVNFEKWNINGKIIHFLLFRIKLFKMN